MLFTYRRNVKSYFPLLQGNLWSSVCNRGESPHRIVRAFKCFYESGFWFQFNFRICRCFSPVFIVEPASISDRRQNWISCIAQAYQPWSALALGAWFNPRQPGSGVSDPDNRLPEFGSLIYPCSVFQKLDTSLSRVGCRFMGMNIHIRFRWLAWARGYRKQQLKINGNLIYQIW